MQMNENMQIRQTVSDLMKDKGITKVKLGAILGDGRDESNQQKFTRASRFLSYYSCNGFEVERVF